jgi:UDP:flavonoid glycosyltransferase YjiC (YdhE family)
VEFHALRPDITLHDKELQRRLIEPKRGLERVVREVMLPVLRTTYDDLLAAVQKDGGADLLISQLLIFAAPLIAEKTGLHWVSTELQPGAFISVYDPPVLAPIPALAKLRSLGVPFHRGLFRLAKFAARSLGDPVRQLRRELGLPPGTDPIFEGRHSPQLVLALFSGMMGEPQPDWPATTLVTGFPFYDENGSSLPPELLQFLADGEPPIIFTLGSSVVWDAGSFYVESATAARKLRKRAVLLVGNDPLNHPREPVSEHVTAVPYAPYAQIFPRASAIVHHGGIGTTGQALRAGKPMLVVPYGGDQYDNGARVTRLGVGRVMRRNHYRADRAAVELKYLLEDPTYLQNAARIGRKIQEENGVRAACEAIEKHLTPPRLACGSALGGSGRIVK